MSQVLTEKSVRRVITSWGGSSEGSHVPWPFSILSPWNTQTKQTFNQRLTKKQTNKLLHQNRWPGSRAVKETVGQNWEEHTVFIHFGLSVGTLEVFQRIKSRHTLQDNIQAGDFQIGTLTKLNCVFFYDNDVLNVVNQITQQQTYKEGHKFIKL